MAASTRLTPQQRILRARLAGHTAGRNKEAARHARLEFAISRSRDHAVELAAAAQAAERELAALADDGAG